MIKKFSLTSIWKWFNIIGVLCYLNAAVYFFVSNFLGGPAERFEEGKYYLSSGVTCTEVSRLTYQYVRIHGLITASSIVILLMVGVTGGLVLFAREVYRGYKDNQHVNP